MPFEQIAARRPDLILATDDYALADNFAKLTGIAPTLSYLEGPEADTWQQRTVHIGRALGREPAAQQAIDDVEALVQRTARANPGFAGRTFSRGYVDGGEIRAVPGDVSQTLFEQLGLRLAPAFAALPQGDTPGRSVVSPENLGAFEANSAARPCRASLITAVSRSRTSGVPRPTRDRRAAHHARRARHLTATPPVGHNAPMKGRSVEVIAEISRRAAPAFEADGRVRFAYVFGSVASEQDHPGSDLDLAVLTQPRGTLLDDARLQDALAAALGRSDVDLLILNEAALWLRFRVVAGRVVFSRDERQRVAFREWVEKEFLDFRPYHESYLRAIRDRAQRGALSGG